MNDPKIKDSMTLKDLDQVKALADPLRLQVLEALCHKPMTTKQVAVLLEENPTKLYHHVDLLERAGLIKLVKTQKNRGTVEKYYQGTARRFAVDRKLFEVTSDEKDSVGDLQDAFTSILEVTLSEIRKSIAAKLIKVGSEPRTAMVASVQIPTTQEQAGQVFDKIPEWLKELHSCSNMQGDTLYRLTVAFYPVKKKPKDVSRPASRRSNTSKD
jgi:DNA-binding transcriptional ArsR family regulator